MSKLCPADAWPLLTDALALGPRTDPARHALLHLLSSANARLAQVRQLYCEQILPIGKQSKGTDTLQVKLTIGWSELLSASIRPYAMHGQEVLINGLSNLHGLRPRLVQWRRAITCATDDADQHPGTMHSLLMLERRMRPCIKCRMQNDTGSRF